MALSKIGTNAISDDAVTTAKLPNDAITSAKIADDAVATANIADDAVTTAKLPDDAITSAKIADGTIATANMADDAVTSAKIADGTIATGNIADDAVGNTKLDLAANYAFTGTVTGAGSITTENSGGVSVSGTIGADFTGLPSGIKRIFVNFYGASAGSDTGALIRLGTSSGFVSSGYGSRSNYGTGGGGSDTSGFLIYGTETSNSLNGTVVINHIGNNVFVTSHSCMYNTSNSVYGGGYKDLGATLDRVTVRLVSGGNYDSGLINIMYQS